MTRKELLDTLDRIDRSGIWAFDVAMIRLFFPNETTQGIAVSLSRHAKSGIIERISNGIYANPRASSAPAYRLESLSKVIRPTEQFYLSLETALSEAGYLSQMPNRLTFMTTGRSGEFVTPYGIVEFVHSSRASESFLSDCEYDADREIWIASVAKAARDIKRSARCVDLVDWEALPKMLHRREI